VSSCQKITTPGVYRLTTDLAAVSGHCLAVENTQQVTIQCDGRSIRTGDQTLGAAVYIGNSSSVTVTGCVLGLVGVKSRGLEMESVSGVSIRNNRISSVSINFQSSVERTGSGLVFTDNVVLYHLQQKGMNNSVIANNRFEFLEEGIIPALVLTNGGTGTRIVGNFMDGRWDGRPESFARQGADDGVVLENETGAVVENNNIVNHWDCGIENVGYVRSAVIRNNQIASALVCGIGGWYDSNWTDTLIEGNLVSQSGTLFAFYRSDGGKRDDTLSFANNRFVRNKFVSFRPNVADVSKGQPSDIDFRLIPASVDRLKTRLEGNVMAGNDFGGTFGAPDLYPSSAFVDGGGNVCGVSGDKDFPLACGRASTREAALELFREVGDVVAMDSVVQLVAPPEAVSFDWTLERLETSAVSGDDHEERLRALALGRTPKDVQRVTTHLGSLSLAPLRLPAGKYTLRVDVKDARSRVFFSASKEITLVPGSSDAVRVYPNPWRSDLSRDRPIVFEGIVEGSTVKIFTLSGFWVRNVKAAGTSASWDLKNDGGDLVASGVYLYLIESPSGSKTRGKLAIVR
jgi:hypothetical protein